jgi:TonB family protein
MQSAVEWTKRTLRSVLLSSAFHSALIVCLILIGAAARKKVVETVHPQIVAQIEIAGGSHAIKIKLPASVIAAHTRKPVPDPDASKRTPLPIEQPKPKMAGGGAPVSPHTGDGSNTALRGNGSDAQDVRPAFPVFSPRPPVTDRSLLPSSEQKIVVDVNVDASGDVVSESLVKGLGNNLDQLVLDIVKTWRFHPATVDGKPVPTQAELIFPFNQSYPITVS